MTQPVIHFRESRREGPRWFLRSWRSWQSCLSNVSDWLAQPRCALDKATKLFMVSGKLESRFGILLARSTRLAFLGAGDGGPEIVLLNSSGTLATLEKTCGSVCSPAGQLAETSKLVSHSLHHVYGCLRCKGKRGIAVMGKLSWGKPKHGNESARDGSRSVGICTTAPMTSRRGATRSCMDFGSNTVLSSRARCCGAHAELNRPASMASTGSMVSNTALRPIAWAALYGQLPIIASATTAGCAPLASNAICMTLRTYSTSRRSLDSDPPPTATSGGKMPTSVYHKDDGQEPPGLAQVVLSVQGGARQSPARALRQKRW